MLVALNMAIVDPQKNKPRLETVEEAARTTKQPITDEAEAEEDVRTTKEEIEEEEAEDEELFDVNSLNGCPN